MRLTPIITKKKAKLKDWKNPDPAENYNLVFIGASTAGLVTASVGTNLGALIVPDVGHSKDSDLIFPWSIYATPEVARVCLTLQKAEKQNIGIETDTRKNGRNGSRHPRRRNPWLRQTSHPSRQRQNPGRNRERAQIAPWGSGVPKILKRTSSHPHQSNDHLRDSFLGFSATPT